MSTLADTLLLLDTFRREFGKLSEQVILQVDADTLQLIDRLTATLNEHSKRKIYRSEVLRLLVVHSLKYLGAEVAVSSQEPPKAKIGTSLEEKEIVSLEAVSDLLDLGSKNLSIVDLDTKKSVVWD